MEMMIKDIFQKDITRKINGVVKAEQNKEDVILTEISEYVVTSELKKYFNKFFDRYVESLNNPTEDVGVWISGFYGSGKSHFLKMIGNILRNEEYSGKKVCEFFKEKIDDPILQGNFERASSVPTDVILFNIDNVSDQDSHQNKDSIAVAFMKNFNGHFGFSKNNLKIAEFERKIWEDGKLEDFKKTIEEISGKSWKDIQRILDFHQDDFIDAVEELGIMSGKEAERWIEKDDKILVSPESFADEVEHYLKLKEPNHRIVFLVDEIGQYIGDNSNLMLNLQTLVEILGLRFKGRVWVGVTSQQDLGSIVSTEGHRRNDFSKIQDRFKTMLSLSSGNIDEVIKKRILKKKEIDVKDLENLYSENYITINNIVDFGDKGRTIPLYKDSLDFSETYPFVGYQFNLLQKVFEKIRDMGHSGQHMSRGERSLLSSFQEAGIRMKDRSVGALVPFNYFFESIEQFLEDIAKRPFTIAKNERGVNDFELEVLKLLFLLKGLGEEMPSNINNITSLMIDSIECDRISLQNNIKKALEKLEREVLIQKDGDRYYFLTNEEQDINKEINQENVDINDIYRELSNYIFNDIFNRSSIISEENGNKYGFSKKIDDYVCQKRGEQLDLVILTPYSDEFDKVQLYGARDEYNLIIRLPKNDTLYLDEIRQSLKISSYTQKKSLETAREVVVQILMARQKQNQERKKRISKYIGEAILNADVFIYGEKKDIKGSSGEKIIEQALQEEAKHRFKSADFIKRSYDESMIKTLLSYSYEGEGMLFDINRDMDSNPNKKALEEVRGRIEWSTNVGKPITLGDLVEHFTKAPYGWGVMSVNGLVAELWNYKIVDIEVAKEKIKESEKIKEYLTKIQVKNLEKVLVLPKEEIDTQLITKVNNVLKEIFGASCEISIDSPKEELLKIIEGKKNIANSHLTECEKEKLPGRKELERWIDFLSEIYSENKNKKTEKVLIEFAKNKKEFSDEYNSQILVETFYEKDSQKERFKNARKKIKSIDENLGYLKTLKDLDAYEKLMEIISDKKPYTRIKDIDGLINSIEIEEQNIIENEKNILIAKGEESKERLANILKDETEILNRIDKEFDKFNERVKNSKTIQNVMSESKELENISDEMERLYKNSIKDKINKIQNTALKALEDKDDSEELNKKIRNNYENLKNDIEFKNIEDISQTLEVAEKDRDEFILEANGKAKKKERVKINKIYITAKYNIETEEEINEYINNIENELKALKEKMLKAVAENKIVDIN